MRTHDDVRKIVDRAQASFRDIESLRNLTPQMPAILEERNPLLENAKANHASEFHRRLVAWINAFQANLDERHEVGIRLVNFGQTLVFHLDDLGYWNPSLILFKGRTDGGDPVELIQHVSQISALLMKLPRADPSQPRRPYGFHAPEGQPGPTQPGG